MNNTTKVIAAVVAVAVIATAAVLLGDNKSPDNNALNEASNTDVENNTTDENRTSGDSNSTAEGAEESDADTIVTVSYTNSGFNPSKVTVPAGGTLRIVNESRSTTRPSSDPHPVHTNNSELNFPELSPSQSADLTLTRAGTWGIHNHYQTSHTLTVTVE